MDTMRRTFDTSGLAPPPIPGRVFVAVSDLRKVNVCRRLGATQPTAAPDDREPFSGIQAAIETIRNS